MPRSGKTQRLGSSRARGVVMSEAELQASVIELAHVRGWMVAHFRANVLIQRKDGNTYRATPVQADGAGFPDLVLCRRDRVLFVELKAQRGVLSPAQARWLANLALALPDGSVFVWKPADWHSGEIDRVLL